MTPEQRHLAAHSPEFEALVRRIGPRPDKPDDQRPPYARLLRAITHQQLNGRAAETIFGRFVGLFPGHDIPPPDQVLARPETELRAAGLSFSKIAAIRDIAAKTLDGVVPAPDEAHALPDDELITRLVTIRGVGRWTVEMLLIDMGRPDVLPVDDFGVREGYRILHSLEAQPRPKELARIGEAWAPYRSTASWYLWRAADEHKRVKTATP